jgi:hypothetical protein
MRLLELLIKGAGHKYIKRIPVGTTKSGTTRYRYIYSSTSTVGGKNLLDEAHLKPGTKLMLQSKDGAEVHAHIESVDGDQVTFKYDDGDRKGETRTVSKQKLLGEFNQENKVGEQIESAKAALLADIKAAADRGTTPKQLARLIARLERLGGSMDKEGKPGDFTAKEESAINDAMERYALNPFRDFTRDELDAIHDKLAAAKRDSAEGSTERLRIDRAETAVYNERNKRIDQEYKDKKEAEERSRLGSKLKRALESDKSKNAKAKAKEARDKAVAAATSLYTREQAQKRSYSPVDMSSYNHADAQEIAEAHVKEQPYSALRVMDIVEHAEKHKDAVKAAEAKLAEEKSANYLNRQVKIRAIEAAKEQLATAQALAAPYTGNPEQHGFLLAELVHNEPPTTLGVMKTARERDIASAVNMFEYYDTTTKAGKRSAGAKKAQEDMISKLEQHIEEYYPKEDSTPFKGIRAKIRAALETQISEIKAHSNPSEEHKAKRKAAVIKIEGIARGKNLD